MGPMTNRKRAWVVGVLAGSAFAAVPVPFVGVSAARGQSYEELSQQVNDTERELRDADAKFAQETAGMSKGSRPYREAAARREASIKEIRARRAKLKDQAERAKGRVSGERVGAKLDDVGSAIENEKKRHAEAMKHTPAGSMAAQEEEQRHQDRLRDIRMKRDDIKEDRDSARVVKQSGQEYKRDTKALANAIEGENSRHAKARKYLPANSPQAQEEERFHAQRLAEINQQFGAAADRRDVTVTSVRADKAVDGELDNVAAQIATERARHDRRMAQVNAGSAAHAEETRQHNETMARLTGRKAELENQAANTRGAAQEKYALKRQLDDIDRALAEENTRFQRRLNDVQSGSEIERLEREQHDRKVAELNARRNQVVAQLN